MFNLQNRKTGHAVPEKKSHQFEILPAIKGTTCYGAFDELVIDGKTSFLTGWVFDSSNLDEVLKVVAYGDDKVIGEGFANLERPDVYNVSGTRLGVGFKIYLRPTGVEKKIKLLVGEDIVLYEQDVAGSLPVKGLTKDDVSVVFNLLFHRKPENEEVIEHQLEVHKEKETFLRDMFKSPEFFEKNPDIVALVKKSMEV